MGAKINIWMFKSSPIWCIFKIVGSFHKWRRVADGDIDADVVLEADCDVGADVADDADVGGEADGENWKQGGPALQLQPHGAEI